MTARRTGKGDDKYKRAANGIGTTPRLLDDGYWHAWVPFVRPDGTPDRKHIKRRDREKTIELYTEMIRRVGHETQFTEMVAPGTGCWRGPRHRRVTRPPAAADG